MALKAATSISVKVNASTRGIKAYLSKMKGNSKRPPRIGPLRDEFLEAMWAWLGSAAGIGICAYLSTRYFEPQDTTLILGSFGASAVLVYGTIKSPLAQPRNLIGGHLISSVIGVAMYQTIEVTWLAAALAVSCAIVAMILTNTVHPPGGATALIAVIGSQRVHNLGFLYALVPAGAGAVILLLVALLVNNLSRNRSFPEYWF